MSSDESLSVWFCEKSDAAIGQAIARHAEYLEDRQSDQRLKDRVNVAMYENRYTFKGRHRRPLSVMTSGRGAPIKLNVIKSCVDTLVAKISLDLPIVEVAGSNAEWSYKLRAKRMTRFITTKQEETGFRREAPQAFKDMLLTGGGAIHITSEHGEIVHERVPKYELLIDDIEGRYGDARNIHHRKQFAREVLCARFPKKKHLIMEAKEAEAREYESETQGLIKSNLVDVRRSIHLPSAPGEKDGLCVYTLIDGQVLTVEPWERPRLPYAFMRWSRPTRGFWGGGLVEDLAPIQYSIDKTLETLERGFDLGAPLRVFLQRSSKIIKTQLLAQVGTIVECSGAPPDIRAPSNPVSQQQINWLMHCIEWMYSMSGISQMSASSKVPAQLESGEALKVHHDFETQRFQHVENEYQNLALDAAERAIDEAKYIYTARDDSGKRIYRHYSAKWVSRDVVEKIDWGSVDLDRDHFKLKLRPIAYLSGTAAGRLDRFNSLAKSGLVPKHWLLPMFEDSDLERFMRIETANFNYAEWYVETLMDEDAEMPPVVTAANLEFLLAHTKACFIDSIVDRAPDAVQMRFSNALDAIRHEAGKAQPMASAPMPGAGALPPGAAPVAMEGQALPGAPMAPPAA